MEDFASYYASSHLIDVYPPAAYPTFNQGKKAYCGKTFFTLLKVKRLITLWLFEKYLQFFVCVNCWTVCSYCDNVLVCFRWAGVFERCSRVKRRASGRPIVISPRQTHSTATTRATECEHWSRLFLASAIARAPCACLHSAPFPLSSRQLRLSPFVFSSADRQVSFVVISSQTITLSVMSSTNFHCSALYKYTHESRRPDKKHDPLLTYAL